jgi:hypothetical protein
MEWMSCPTCAWGGWISQTGEVGHSPSNMEVEVGQSQQRHDW